ncbi:MAG: hypothetical protein M1831_006165 [Alyxoria varia]|nr:MAG: hypothetical protein M1831_006165 [Alyxoria varia]
MSMIDFKSHYESSHVPLLQRLAADLFPRCHTRHYIQQPNDSTGNTTAPRMLAGDPESFDYDGFAILEFVDENALQALLARMGEKDAADAIAEDEEKFLDRSKTKIVMADETRQTCQS